MENNYTDNLKEYFQIEFKNLAKNIYKLARKEKITEKEKDTKLQHLCGMYSKYFDNLEDVNVAMNDAKTMASVKGLSIKKRALAIASAGILLVGATVGFKSCGKDINKNKSTIQAEASDDDIKNTNTDSVANDDIYDGYAYNYNDLRNDVPTELASLGDINVSNTDEWLAGASNMTSDTELMLKFYIAANTNTLYQPNSPWASVVQKYTSSDLYTSFFAVLDNLQSKAVFATGADNDIRLSKYFVSDIDREYIENLENLLITYNNAKEDKKDAAREEISKWVDENVVEQNYGSVSSAAIITSYRLIQNARLTNAVENIKALDKVDTLEELDKVDDKYKTTADYLIIKFVDSKDISCEGYDDNTTTVKPILSDDSINFIENVKEFHDTLFIQNSDSLVTNKELIKSINEKRTVMAKEQEKTADELKDEYLEKLEKVNPSDPALTDGASGDTAQNQTLSEEQKEEIRKDNDSNLSSGDNVKDSDGNTLAEGSEAETYDTAAYTSGYNAGSAQGTKDGSVGKGSNNSTTGKSEYIAGYKAGYDASYSDAKAAYDKAVEENKKPTVTEDKTEDIKEPTESEGSKVTESEGVITGGDNSSSNESSSSTSDSTSNEETVVTTPEEGYEFYQNPDGSWYAIDVSDGSIIILDDSYAQEDTSVKTLTK